GALDEEQSGRRVLAGKERAPDVARSESRQIREQRCEFGNDASVMPRVRNQEQEALRGIVSPLEVDAPKQRLHVTQPHLELDRRPGTPTEKDGIPCALLRAVAHGWEWNFNAVG